MTRMSVSQSSWAGEGSSRSLPQKNLRFFFCFFFFLSFGLFSFDFCSILLLLFLSFILFFRCWHRRYPAPPPSSHPKVSPQWLNPPKYPKSLKVGQSGSRRSRSRGTSITMVLVPFCYTGCYTWGLTCPKVKIPPTKEERFPEKNRTRTKGFGRSRTRNYS